MELEKTPKTFNARFAKETMWAIADLIGAKYGRDKTEAVTRAIMEAKERVDSGETIRGYGYSTPSRPGTGSTPIEQENSAPVFTGWPITCKHCGEVGAKGPTKFGTICYGCKADKHSNDPSECPICTMKGTGAL